MPTPHEFYEDLLTQITDEVERKVFEVFTRRIGQKITRKQLVQEVFGVYVDKYQLAQDGHDRMVRRYIEQLRLKGFPIVATSGEAGYILVDDPDQMDAYIAEECARVLHIQNKINMLYRAKQVSKSLHEWREAAQMPIQERMF